MTPGWPGRQLVVRDIRVAPGTQVTMLGRAGVLSHRLENGRLVVDLPALGPDEAPCQHAFAFKITGAEMIPGE
ncbi:MAG: hypothetical protein N3J91_03925 [Verrucomicrobiae bacterium]|nr:hypothetical protein [Verrucomicrobiae bacterium]